LIDIFKNSEKIAGETFDMKSLSEILYSNKHLVNSSTEVKKIKRFRDLVSRSGLPEKNNIVDYLNKKIDFSDMAVNKRNYDFFSKKRELKSKVAYNTYSTIDGMITKLSAKNISVEKAQSILD
jgi:hypothetical protein